ncbi:MAG: glycosyltransferase, partial [bacterium]|nr:glycosyltransferase [bacterium]
MSDARVLAVIVNYNGGHWVEEAVESLLAQTTPLDILVVDNMSSDGSPRRLRER